MSVTVYTHYMGPVSVSDVFVQRLYRFFVATLWLFLTLIRTFFSICNIEESLFVWSSAGKDRRIVSDGTRYHGALHWSPERSCKTGVVRSTKIRGYCCSVDKLWPVVNHLRNVLYTVNCVSCNSFIRIITFAKVIRWAVCAVDLYDRSKSNYNNILAAADKN